MPDSVLYTNAAALTEAELVALTLADSTATPPQVGKIRLYDGTIVPTVNTVKADLVAAETTLVGYPVGGYSVTDMGPPLFAPGGGVVIQTPLVNVVYASGPPVTIGGYWFEDHSGNVREVFIYDPQRSLATIGDGWPIVAQFGYGRNTV